MRRNMVARRRVACLAAATLLLGGVGVVPASAGVFVDYNSICSQTRSVAAAATLPGDAAEGTVFVEGEEVPQGGTISLPVGYSQCVAVVFPDGSKLASVAAVAGGRGLLVVS